MEEYKIFCTSNQTQIAKKLGAPIIGNIRVDPSGAEELLFIPTAEEMIGWLDSKGIHCIIDFDGFGFKYSICVKMIGDDGEYGESGRLFQNFEHYNTRNEAILNAIDYALDSLIIKL